MAGQQVQILEDMLIQIMESAGKINSDALLKAATEKFGEMNKGYSLDPYDYASALNHLVLGHGQKRCRSYFANSWGKIVHFYELL